MVLLNKGNKPAKFSFDDKLQAGEWKSAISGNTYTIDALEPRFKTEVPAHGVEVLLFDGALSEPALLSALDRLQAGRQRRTNGG